MKCLATALSFGVTAGTWAAPKPGPAPATREQLFQWSNPIYIQGKTIRDGLRDPDIIKDGETYYMVYTMWPFGNYTERNADKPDYGSSPGIALYSSHDLKHWEMLNWILKSSDLPQDCPYKHQFWAPEIHKIGTRYYIIFGASNWIAAKYNVGGHMGYYQFIGVSDAITGPYSHFTALRGPGVDTSLFQDDDGQTYLVWPRNQVHPVDLTKIDQGIVDVGPSLSQAAVPEDFKAIGKPAPETIEGPYMIKHAGTYYLFFAETYRGPEGFYDTGVATARSLHGPWKLDPRWRIFPGGHQSEFRGPDGNWWTAFRHEESPLAPWLSIDPIYFSADGAVQVSPTIGLAHVPLSRHSQP